MKIIEINIDKLNPAEYNPRKDLQAGDEEFEKIKRSITEFGMVEPIVWNERTGNVVGGHQRLKVLKDLGYEKVKVSVVNLDDAKEKALNIALNNIEGEWDNKLLKDLLVELDTGEIDIELTGFNTDEIEDMVTETIEVEEKPEIEFTEELLEEHNYVVLYFDNEIDWQTAVDKLGITTKKALDSRDGYERKGVGRVIRGAEVIERLD